MENGKWKTHVTEWTRRRSRWAIFNPRFNAYPRIGSRNDAIYSPASNEGSISVLSWWTADIQMKWRCDYRSYDCDLSNRKLSPKNVFRAWTGFEPVASALALQCSTNWAMKTHALGLHSSVGVPIPLKPRKHFSIFDCLNRNHNCDDHILTSMRVPLFFYLTGSQSSNRPWWTPRQSKFAIHSKSFVNL